MILSNKIAGKPSPQAKSELPRDPVLFPGPVNHGGLGAIFYYRCCDKHLGSKRLPGERQRQAAGQSILFSDLPGTKELVESRGRKGKLLILQATWLRAKGTRSREHGIRTAPRRRATQLRGRGISRVCGRYSEIQFARQLFTNSFSVMNMSNVLFSPTFSNPS